MKDINLEDLPAPKQLSVQDLPSPDQLKTTPIEKPGIGESALRGLEQGATFGYGDEINGGLETLLNQATGKSPDGLSFLDEYAKHRDESRNKMEAAEAAHPYVSGAANLAGAIAPALLTGGGSLAEEGLAGVATQGAKYGALAGLGNSKADLTKGEIGKAATDTALGGALGGITAPVAGAVSDILQPSATALASKLGGISSKIADIGPVSKTIESFKQGLKGRELLTQSGQKALGQEIGGVEGDIGSDLQQVFNDAKSNKMNTLLSDGPTVDLPDWKTNADQMMDNLKNTRGQNSAVLDDIKRVRNIIDGHILGNEEEDIPGKGLSLSTDQAETLLRQLGDLGSASETSGLKTNEGKELVNRLISPLNREPNLIDVNMGVPQGQQSLSELVNASRPGVIDNYGNLINSLSEQNSTLSGLAKSSNMIPDTRNIINYDKNSASGIISSDKMEKFLSGLPPEMQDKYRDKIADLSKAKGVSEAIANSGGLSRGLVEKVSNKLGYGGANWAGIGTKALYDMTPDMLRDLGTKVAAHADPVYQNLGRVLNQAADKDQIGRNALFFSLQQNPEYRKVLKDISGDQ